jgi:hypothetical protein
MSYPQRTPSPILDGSSSPSNLQKNKKNRDFDMASTIGTKDQRTQGNLQIDEHDSSSSPVRERANSIGSDELLDELIASQRRENIIQGQMEEELIANTKSGDTSPVSSIARNKGPAQDNDALNDSNVLIPAMAKDIKADIALPKRRAKLQRSRTSALVDLDDRRLSELSHVISSVLSVDIDTHEMLRRFTDKLHQCSMSVEAMLRYNPEAGEKVRQSALEELVEVLEGSNSDAFLTNAMLPDLIRMVKANMFRDLPRSPAIIPVEEYDPEDSAVQSEWNNLNNVYKIMFRILCNQFQDAKVLNSLWNMKAMTKIVSLLLDNGIDSRERRFTKIILHRSYAKV